MGLTQNLGRLSPSIFSDASLNIGVGAAPSGSYKFEVTGTSKVSGVLTLGATLSNGTYTYTLPAATGTLALTSDIPSLTGYVPYAGATANVNLGVYNLAGGNVNINGGGSGGGALRLKQFASSEANLEGYNSISTLTSGVFYFTSSASVPNFKNFILNPSGLTDNTLRTYALPNADGTLALTSDLGAYLPLTGGTLTGALSGTSATFSSSGLPLTLSTSGGRTDQLVLTQGASTQKSHLGNFAGNTYLSTNWYYNGGNAFDDNTLKSASIVLNGDGSINLNINNVANTNPSTALTLASTGAATFSSSVTAGGNIAAVATGTANAFLTASGSTGSYSGIVSLQRGGTEDGVLYTASTNYSPVTGVSAADIVLYAAGGGRSLRFATSSSSVALTIASTGAATFSSSIYAATTITANTTVTARLGYTTAGNSTNPSYDDALIIDPSGNGVAMVKLLGGNQFASDYGTALKFTVNGGSGPNNPIDVMTLRSTGNVGIGTLNPTSTAYPANGRLVVFGDESQPNLVLSTAGSSSFGVMRFVNANGIAGSISMYPTSVSYNTSSDYRLKQDLKDFKGLDLISAIKTYDYEWKADNKRAYGVLAHELQEVLPQAVFGEKDGKEMQGVDYSKIVPILVKAIQELTQKVNTLNN